MAKPIVTIIGLGVVGSGMGLGLQREEPNFEIVGHDKAPEVAQAARKLGAVHRNEWNLFRACEGAELIVLAVPLSELDELLKLLAEEVKPGTLILTLTSLLQPAIDTATRHLPAGVHFVAGHPVLTTIGGTPTPTADLFDNVVFALDAGVKTEPEAVQLASDFVERVGATPLFVDAQEHDGIIAGVEQLPQLLAAALMRMSVAAPGWREARRLAGHQFAGATDLGNNAAGLFAALQDNKQNVAVRLRQLREELAVWAELLEAGPEEADEKHPLLAALEGAVEERGVWEAQTVTKNWEERPNTGASDVNTGGFFRQMFLGNLMGKKGNSNHSDN